MTVSKAKNSIVCSSVYENCSPAGTAPNIMPVQSMSRKALDSLIRLRVSIFVSACAVL